MDSYQVIMTQDAADDLVELRDYIAYSLYARDTALMYIKAIREEIGSLSVMPGRNALIADEPWRSRGIRRTIVKNFYIYYRINEKSKSVYVLNVIYARRDQLKTLASTRNDF